MNIFRFNTYREILDEKFQERVKRNPRYSLRAFGRDLNMSSSGITEVMNGKLGLSRARATAISRTFDFGKVETDYFLNLVLSEDARGEKERRNASLEAKKLREIYKNVTWLSLQKFEVIAQWHHLAILEAAYLNDFNPTPSWLSKRLNIDKKKIVGALERMHKLEIITFDGQQYSLRHGTMNVFTIDKHATEGLTLYHKEFLTTAAKKVGKINPTEREFSVGMLAINKDSVPELKQKLRAFFDEFVMQNEGRRDLNELYYLGLQFFPLNS